MLEHLPPPQIKFAEVRLNKTAGKERVKKIQVESKKLTGVFSDENFTGLGSLVDFFKKELPGGKKLWESFVWEDLKGTDDIAFIKHCYQYVADPELRTKMLDILCQQTMDFNQTLATIDRYGPLLNDLVNKIGKLTMPSSTGCIDGSGGDSIFWRDVSVLNNEGEYVLDKDLLNTKLQHIIFVLNSMEIDSDNAELMLLALQK